MGTGTAIKITDGDVLPPAQSVTLGGLTKQPENSKSKATVLHELLRQSQPLLQMVASMN